MYILSGDIMIIDFEKLVTSIDDVDQVNNALQLIQERISDSFRSLSDDPTNNGLLIENISLATGVTNLVPHGLGRPIRGWSIWRKNAAASIYEVTATTDSDFLALATTANVIVTLKVI